MDHSHQNWNQRFTRRSSLSDGYYVRMEDDRLTVPRVLGGLMFAGTLVLAYVVLAAWF